jgi:hypothetical protein
MNIYYVNSNSLVVNYERTGKCAKLAGVELVKKMLKKQQKKRIKRLQKRNSFLISVNYKEVLIITSVHFYKR